MNLISIYRAKCILAATLLLSCFPAYAQRTIPVDTSHVTTLRIDPGNSLGGNVSDVFQEVDYIPLETNAESTFGSVDQLIVSKNYYIILDYNTNAILIFDKAGKFHAKIKEPRDNPRYKIWKFLVNNWTNQIVYFTDNLSTTVYCDFDGKKVKQEKSNTPVTPVNNLLRSYFISADSILNYTQYWAPDTSVGGVKQGTRSLLQYVGSNRSVYATSLPYTAAESKIDVLSTGIGPLTRFGSDTALFFSKPYANSIYTVTPQSITLSYKLVFPLLNSLPPDFSTNASYNGKRYTFIEKNRTAIFSISNCYRVGNNLLFKAGSYSRNAEDNLIYNLTSGDVIAYKRITPDERSFFLPIFDDIGSTFENVGLAACDGEYLYSSMSSLCLFKAKEGNAEQKVNYNPVLTVYFNKSNKNSNPVLLRVKLKNEL